MNLFWPLLILGGGAAAYVLTSKSSTSAASGTGQTPAQLAQANASFQAAQAFDAQAQALGLTQAQAQAAYDTGLTPQEYAQGVLGQGTQTGLAGNPAVAQPSAGAPLALDFYGEYEPQSGDPIYRDSETGQPILVDSLGQFWTFAEAAAVAA
jgi:hypothetical protein